jgi:hypothetical protein
MAAMLLSFALLSGGPTADVANASQTTALSSQATQQTPTGNVAAKSAANDRASGKSSPSATAPCAGNSTGTSPPQTPCNPRVRKHRTQKPPAADPAGGPSKTVVRNGSAEEPGVELGPGVSEQQASQQQQKTSQMLLTADANLKTAAARHLSSEQQETVRQIKSYMEQSKAAADDGDVQRAYNLATKANLLSAELVGH